MKKLTLLILACSMSLMTFAQGSITYVLNGGVTNDYGWANKIDMLVTFSDDYNTVFGTETAWGAGTQPGGIQGATFTNGIYGIFADETVGEKWTWLKDYVLQVATDSEHSSLASLIGENETYWRGAIDGFFTNSQHAAGAWNETPNFTSAGQPQMFIPFWGHAFAGPSSYDGATEVIIPDPYKEGDSFLGWYNNAEFSGERITSISVGTTGDITLYARFGEYIPTCGEVWALNAGETTKVIGIVTFVDGNNVYIQDATAGLLVEFAVAPGVVAGDEITVLGTTALVGEYVKITSATLESKLAVAIPNSQTITLATLVANATPYMYELIHINGLTITSYDGSGNATLSDDETNSIATEVVLNQADLPIGTKVNVELVVAYGTAVKLIGNASNVERAPLGLPDPYTYPERDERYNLTNKWLITSNMDNLSANPIGLSGHVRGMTAKDGKMYFVDRNLKQLTVVDGATGEKLAPIALADYIFTYENSEGVQATAGTLPFNDIKQDNAGNILLGNCIASGAQPFQVWKIDLATGEGELVLQVILSDDPDFAELPIRFDAFGVWGDVDGDAVIMAANASALEAYKWVITNGVVDTYPILIEIDNGIEGTTLTGKANPGTAPQIFPLDENYFYLDGNATFPVLIDENGEVYDDFLMNNNDALFDNITNPDKIFEMNEGHNGIVEFEMNDEYFMLMAASNTERNPRSSFRLFKFKDASKMFQDMEVMWTFPEAGMGSMSNAYRTAVPSVEVNGGVATIYVYTGENGYGVYEFTDKDYEGGGDVSIDNLTNANVKIFTSGKSIRFSEEVANVAVFNIAGQQVVKADNASSVNVIGNGIFVVKGATQNGETFVSKVVIR